MDIGAQCDLIIKKMAIVDTKLDYLIDQAEKKDKVIYKLVEACKDVESKIVDFNLGRINWRPDDFLERIRKAVQLAKEQ